MKTLNIQKPRLTIAALMVLTLVAGNALAQNSTTSTSTGTAQPAAISQSAPQLPYGVSEILQLSQAKVGDNVIISYIQNSGNGYGLNAAQIIYLRQQGVSEAVINTMLNQHSQTTSAMAATAPQPTTPAPNNPDTGNTQTTTAAGQSSTAYVPANTTSTVYVVPNTQPYYYSYPYPYYYYPYAYGWPAVSLSFGWGGYWGGYHYHGGYNGWHGGGWHH